MRSSKFKGIAVLLLGSIVIFAFMYLFVTSFSFGNHAVTCERISAWALEQQLSVGAHPHPQIPASLGIPSGSEVNLVKTAQGAIVVLLKTKIEWKGNYTGVLYSTAPLGKSEIVSDAYGREQIIIPGIDANPPVIREHINPKFFSVYFDLN